MPVPGWVFLGLALLVWAWASLRWREAPARVEALLAAPRAPLWLGAASAAVTGWTWGSLAQVAVVHDEAAYVLQARIFASGRWAAPSPPLPEFFEQYHVLVVPTLAAKYPPGHALAMAPGALLGLPGLVPVLLAGLSGALLFVLARRAAGPWVALLAWLFWMAAPDGLQWRASYFSEATSGAAWLAAWWALERWRATERPGWLLAVAFATGWGAITRPLTMLAFAVPLGVCVLILVWRRRAWRSLAGALAVGTAVLCLLPVWSARTTGDWRTSPVSLYTRDYLPWDVPGFGLRDTPPARPLPRDMQVFSAAYRALHAEHLPARLPGAAAERAWAVARGMWGWRMDGVPPGAWAALGALLFLLGCLAWTPEVRLVAASSAAVLAAYLVYAHGARWTLYYAELLPGLAFVSALGLWRALGWAAARARRPSPAAAARGALFAAGALLVFLCVDAALTRQILRERMEFHRATTGFFASVPDRRTLVFIRYAPNHNPHQSLILNEPDLARARVVRVYDRGAENERLMRLFPDRTPFLFDEAAGTLTRITPPPAR